MNAAAALPAMVANLAKPRKYVSSTDCAKLIRQALKEAYPEIKFSVVTDKYAGGSSIRVRYQAEVMQKDIERIAKAFQGGSFDGMTDCKGYLRKTMNGEPTSFGVDFVFVDRDLDKAKLEAMAKIIDQVRAIARENGDDPENIAANFLIRFGIAPDLAFAFCRYNSDGYQVAGNFLRNQSDPKFAGRTSKLADSVTFLSDSNDRND